MEDNESQKIISFIKSIEADKRFSGIWSGTDHGKFFRGETNSWVINRRMNGTFTVSFKTIHSDNSVIYSHDNGFWGIKDNDYFEYRDSDEKADHYTYLFLSNDSIHFTINEEIKHEEPYNFIDYRILLD